MPIRDSVTHTTDILHPSAQRATGTGNGETWYGYGPVAYMKVQVKVTAVTGAPGLTVKVQDSIDDGATWSDLATTTSRNAVGSDFLEIGVGTATNKIIGDLVRIQWTVATAATNATFEVRSFAQAL